MSSTEIFLSILAILAGLILLLVLLIFTARLKAKISYDGEKFGLTASLLGVIRFKFGAHAAPADTRVKLSDYSLKRLKKKKRKTRTAKKPEPPGEEEKSNRLGILAIIQLIKTLLFEFFTRHTRHISVRTARLKIKVATGDAASTSILYGAVIQGVAYILEILNSFTDLGRLKKSEISITPDYLSDKLEADIIIVIKFPIWCALSLLLRYLRLSRIAKKDADKAD